jgi:polysaccharide biosynthesis transport protein
MSPPSTESNLVAHAPAERQAVQMNAIDPREILRILRRQIRLVLIVPLVVVLLAAGYVMTATPLYTGVSTVFIDPRRATVADPSGAPVLSSFGTDDSTVESQVLLIQSAAVLRRVVDKLDLTADPEFVPEPGPIDRIRSLFSRGGANTGGASADDALRSRAVDGLRRKLRVARQRTTFLVEIHVTSREPAKAAAISNAVAESYFTEQVRSRHDSAKIASGWLGRQIDDLKARVMASDKAVQDFRAANNLIAAQGVTVNDQQLTDLNNKLVEARVLAAEARAKFDQVRTLSGKGTDPGSLAEALSSEIVARLRTQYAELAKNDAELSTRYGTRHPSVTGVRAQLRDTQNLIDQEVRRILESRRHQYEVAAAREVALQKSLDDLQGVSSRQSGAQVRLRELQREADASRTVYESFLARLKETSAQESLEMPESRVVSTAAVPLAPSFPNVSMSLALAVAIGFGLGCVLAMIADYLDRRIKSPEQVRSASGLPGLAILPAVGIRELARLAKRGRDELQHYDPRGTRLLPAALQPPLMRYAIDQPTSLFAESVRAIRLSIQREARRRPTQVIMVTSAIDNEGKTTLAANLALSFAAIGVRTALVDGDLRNGELTRSLCPRAQTGVVEAADGSAPLHQAIAIEPSTKLAILPAPPAADATMTTEFMLSDAMGVVLEEMRRCFDIVVVDAPPLLPLVDGRALAEQADCILLAVGWDRTPRDALVRAIELLAPVQDRILGTVLTRADLSRLRFYNDFDETPYAAAYAYSPRTAQGVAR